MSPDPSTTLALSFERYADLSAAVRASVGRSARQGDDDGFSDGRQRWLRRAADNSFLPRSRRRGEDAGGRRKRSWPSARGDEDLAMSDLEVVEAEFFLELLVSLLADPGG